MVLARRGRELYEKPHHFLCDLIEVETSFLRLLFRQAKHLCPHHGKNVCDSGGGGLLRREIFKCRDNSVDFGFVFVVRCA